MNNTILLKGADFSQNKIDSLNIQQLTVTKDGDSYATASGGVITIAADSATWKPSEEYAYSNEISIPAGAKYLFGKITAVCTNSDFNTWKNTPSQANLATAFPVWCYHTSNDSQWHVNTTGVIPYNAASRPQPIAYKPNIYVGDSFTDVMLDGAIYAAADISGLNIDKIIVNWIKKDSVGAPEVGLEVPEIYVSF